MVIGSDVADRNVVVVEPVVELLPVLVTVEEGGGVDRVVGSHPRVGRHPGVPVAVVVQTGGVVGPVCVGESALVEASVVGDLRHCGLENLLLGVLHRRCGVVDRSLVRLPCRIGDDGGSRRYGGARTLSIGIRNGGQALGYSA